jgi:hypothetical protein
MSTAQISPNRCDFTRPPWRPQPLEDLPCLRTLAAPSWPASSSVPRLPDPRSHWLGQLSPAMKRARIQSSLRSRRIGPHPPPTLWQLKRKGPLEERLVDERMAAAGSPEKCSDLWYEAIHAANRDPRYVNAKAASIETGGAEIDTAWGLVAEPLATIAGAAALAAYALEHKSSDLSWPDNEEEEGADDFAAALLRALNVTLSSGAVS